MSWQRVLYAVKDAEHVHAAMLDKVVRLTRALDAKLELFQCLFDPIVASSPQTSEAGLNEQVRSRVEHAHAALERHLPPLRAQGIDVRASVRWDYPAYEGIVRHALRHEADLVVAQAFHGERIGPRVLGYTDFKLIESCPCPLLLLKNPHPYAQGGIIAAVDPLHARDKPAALDDAILDAAKGLAKALSAPLTVFHAIAPRSDSFRLGAELRREPATGAGDAEAAYRETATAKVRQLAQRHEIGTEQTFITEGLVAEALPAQARARSADVTVMGAVSRSLVKRILIGHTAERLLDTLECDVLIMKAPGFRSPVSRASAHHLDIDALQPQRYLRE